METDAIDIETADVVALVTGIILLQFAFKLWGALVPGSWPSVVGVCYVLGAGVGLLYVAVADVDLEKWGRVVAVVALAAAAIGILTLYMNLAPGPDFGTDAALFSRYSIDLLVQGQNPYTHSMMPASEKYDVSLTFVTPRTDGSVVHSVSYPAGAILAFLPQAVSGVGRPSLGMTTFVATVASGVLLIRWSPPEYALISVVSLLGSRNLLWSAFGGVFDMLYVLPLLLAMVYWSRERWTASGLTFGVACTIKQHPWFIAPFLAYWLYAGATSWSEFTDRAKQFVGSSIVAFVAVNLPFIVWDFEAWLTGVFTPVFGDGAPLVTQGNALALTTVTGVYSLPKSSYTALLGLAFAMLFATYVLYWDRLKWTAWIAPPVLLFFHYRSLTSYFVYFAPVAFAALVCRYDAVGAGERVDLRELLSKVVGN